METKYSLLNQYRLKKRMTMTAFSRELGLEIDVVRRTLFGITEPHDYNKIVFDEYYRDHEKEIMTVLIQKEAVNA